MVFSSIVSGLDACTPPEAARNPLFAGFLPQSAQGVTIRTGQSGTARKGLRNSRTSGAGCKDVHKIVGGE